MNGRVWVHPFQNSIRQWYDLSCWIITQPRIALNTVIRYWSCRGSQMSIITVHSVSISVQTWLLFKRNGRQVILTNYQLAGFVNCSGIYRVFRKINSCFYDSNPKAKTPHEKFDEHQGTELTNRRINEWRMNVKYQHNLSFTRISFELMGS